MLRARTPRSTTELAACVGTYAGQNERDYQALAAAAASGRVTAGRDI